MTTSAVYYLQNCYFVTLQTRDLNSMVISWQYICKSLTFIFPSGNRKAFLPGILNRVRFCLSYDPLKFIAFN